MGGGGSASTRGQSDIGARATVANSFIITTLSCEPLTFPFPKTQLAAAVSADVRLRDNARRRLPLLGLGVNGSPNQDNKRVKSVSGQKRRHPPERRLPVEVAGE